MVRKRETGSADVADAALNAPWQQVIGHSRIRRQLAESLRADRAPHALLFSGPPEVGKAAVAIEYAALLLCEESGLIPCGHCPQCAAAARLEHPDLHLIFPLPAVPKKGESNGNSTEEDPAIVLADRVAMMIAQLAQDPYVQITLPKSKRQKEEKKEKSENRIIRISQIRALIHQASLKPFVAPRKVFVLFAADTMNEQAQNALLKVLEDPGSDSHFLLITDTERELRPTIRSRCQKFSFGPLSREEIRASLMANDVAPEKADAAAALCGGRLLHARAMAGGDLLKLQNNVREYLRAAAVCEPAKIIETSAALMETGNLPGDTPLELLGLFLRDAAVIRAGDAAVSSLTFASFEESLERLLSSYPEADLATAAAHADQAAEYLVKGYTQDLVLCALAIKLHEAFGPLASRKPKTPTRHD
jgi:DNA polymerase III delta' subunit